MKKLSKLFTVILFTGYILYGISGTQIQADKAKQKDIILATTTSTQDTGLLDILLPVFETKTGYIVKTIAVGSGQAMALGRKGEADVLLVHSPDEEKKFMKNRYGIRRNLVMHNDFVIAGPATDKANINGLKSASDALKKIAKAECLFISRGDRSGTHVKELKLWEKARIAPEGKKWYQETGLGMGQTLNVANDKEAYLLSDRATFLAFKNKIQLTILVQGDKALVNIYHVIEVNSKKFSMVNAKGAKAFADFILSSEAQKIIKTFGVEKFGSPLYFPDAGKKE